jgi:hypothetical protein
VLDIPEENEHAERPLLEQQFEEHLLWGTSQLEELLHYECRDAHWRETREKSIINRSFHYV